MRVTRGERAGGLAVEHDVPAFLAYNRVAPMMDQTKPEGSPPKRRAPRLKVQLEGRILGRLAQTVSVIDLSRTGCLVQSPAAFDAGAILDIEVALGTERLAAKARVVEASLDGDASVAGAPRYLAGLEFLSLSAQDEARLRRFLDEEVRRRRGADTPAR